MLPTTACRVTFLCLLVMRNVAQVSYPKTKWESGEGIMWHLPRSLSSKLLPGLLAVARNTARDGR